MPTVHIVQTVMFRGSDTKTQRLPGDIFFQPEEAELVFFRPTEAELVFFGPGEAELVSINKVLSKRSLNRNIPERKKREYVAERKIARGRGGINVSVSVA